MQSQIECSGPIFATVWNENDKNDKPGPEMSLSLFGKKGQK
jgi:hypothetical protein